MKFLSFDYYICDIFFQKGDLTPSRKYSFVEVERATAKSHTKHIRKENRIIK